MLSGIRNLPKAVLRAAYCAVLLGLASCGTPVPPASGPTPGAIKTVAIISVLPDTVSMSHVGFTVFGNAFAILPAESDPNDIVRKTAAKALSPRYTVLTPRVDVAAIIAAQNADRQNSWTHVLPPAFTVPHSFTPAEIGQFIKPGAADLVVIFDASEPQDKPYLNYPGWGVISLGTFAVYDSYSVHVLVDVFDGRTFQPVGEPYNGGNAVIPSDLRWEGQAYDALSPSTKASMAVYEQEAVQTEVTTDLAKIGLETAPMH